MEPVFRFLQSVKQYLSIRLFTLGSSDITVWTIIYVLGVFAIIIWTSNRIRDLVIRFLARSSTDIGVRQAIGTIARYVVIVLGLLIIVQTAGVDLSALTILAGALGIGVGLGLQNITNNFLSGVIILFERPIKVGDRVQVGDIAGDILRISPRATTVMTNDNISIVIPNSDFITNTVINWSLTDRNIRIHVPVGVSYSSDVELVKQVLLEVADEHPGVLRKPDPAVLFREFGDSSLNFELLVWTSEYMTRPSILRSELNFIIRRKFIERNIEIPFPQRDLHVRSGLLNVHAQDSPKQSV